MRRAVRGEQLQDELKAQLRIRRPARRGQQCDERRGDRESILEVLAQAVSIDHESLPVGYFERPRPEK